MAQLLSIAIEDTEIKLLLVDGRQVKVAGSLPLEPELVKNGVVQDKATVSQKIRQFLDTEKIGIGRVIASVSGIHAVYRLFSMPRLPRELLAEAMQREAERIMPVPLTELYLSWQAIPLSEEETLVCLLGLPRTTVDSQTDTLRQAGLDPYIMDARPLAVARAGGELKAISVNAEARDFDIVITVNGIPELVRSTAFSRDDLLPPDKAMEIKEELDRTVRFYNASHEEAPVTETVPVILSGKAVIIQLLGVEIPYPLRAVTVPLSHPQDFDVANFATNIGLVLKEMKVDWAPLRLNLNTVPQAYLPKPVPVFPILSWVLVILGICLLAWFGLTVRQAIAQTSTLKAELSQAQAQAKIPQADPKEIKELEAKLQEVLATRDSIRQLLFSSERQRAEVSSDLGKAISLFPGEAVLDSVEYGTVLTVKGVAPDGDTVLSYAKSLRDSGNFSEVLVSFDTRAYHEVSFTLELK